MRPQPGGGQCLSFLVGALLARFKALPYPLAKCPEMRSRRAALPCYTGARFVQCVPDLQGGPKGAYGSLSNNLISELFERNLKWRSAN